MARHTAVAEATRPEPAEIPGEVAGARLRNRTPLLAEEGAKALEVSTIGGECIGGRPSLHLEGREERGDRIHQTTEAGWALAATPGRAGWALAATPRRMVKSIIRFRRKASAAGAAATRAAP